ncbi:MAG TPA: protein FdrA, partial [Candidatus Binatia bacterium]|nr:protein FdrA [Candidatus Binatia bacterium]
MKALVRPSCYQDSVVLMRLAETLRARPGVREAAALMGTPANHELLAAAGLSTPQTKSAGPGDLIIAVAAGDEAAAEAALA